MDSKFKILVLAEQLLHSSHPVLDKIPKSHRYRYGSKLEEALFELLRLIIQASSAKTKSKVYSLVDHINYLHCILRHGANLKLISPNWVAHIMKAPLGSDYGGMLYQITALSTKWRSNIK